MRKTRIKTHDKLTDTDLKILKVLATLTKIKGESVVRCSDIAKYAVNEQKISLSRQLIRVTLIRLNGEYVHITNSGVQIMQKGLDAVGETDSSSGFIFESGTPFTAKQILSQKIFANTNGSVKICDSYINVATLDQIVSIPKKNNIFIMTQLIQETMKGEFIRALNDLHLEGFNIECRVFSKSTLHDRYVIDDRAAWVVGHSIKDLGKKDCTLTQVNDDIRDQLTQLFDRRWKISKSIK